MEHEPFSVIYSHATSKNIQPSVLVDIRGYYSVPSGKDIM